MKYEDLSKVQKFLFFLITPIVAVLCLLGFCYGAIRQLFKISRSKD